MGKVTKNWCKKSLILFLISTSIFVILATIFNEDLSLILYIFIGFFISSLLFFLLGLSINIKTISQISRVNEIIKNSIPKDVLNRNLYSNKNDKDEIASLCCDIENVIFELKASERVKNDFISSMSHELRTPLTAIKGWAETMKMGDLIDFSTVRRGLEIIVKEATRLSGIVEELLDFSLMSNGRLVLNMDKIDILAEVEDAVYMFKEKAIVEQKSLIYNEPKLPLYVCGDKSKLKQVFINIIDNALKYTKSGGSVNVNISEKNDKIVFEVTDNGCGIEKSDLSNVTQKFFKSDNSKRGFGIGLSIVREIVYAHGGTLKILSEKGFGTTVTVSLNPLKTEEENKS